MQESVSLLQLALADQLRLLLRPDRRRVLLPTVALDLGIRKCRSLLQAGESLIARQVGQRAVAGELGYRPRDVEVAERIGWLVRVAPEPVDLAAVDSVHHAVGAKHQGVQGRLSERHTLTNKQTIGVDAGAGDTVETLGDV